MTTQGNDGEPRGSTNVPDTQAFRKALRERLSKAYHRGMVTLDVSAGELYGEAGGEGESEQDLAACQAVMHAAMNEQDRVIATPSRSPGENFTVRYVLPHALP